MLLKSKDQQHDDGISAVSMIRRVFQCNPSKQQRQQAIESLRQLNQIGLPVDGVPTLVVHPYVLISLAIVGLIALALAVEAFRARRQWIVRIGLVIAGFVLITVF